MEVLLSELEARKNVLFGTLSSGISSKCKRSGWESVCEAVNAVVSEKRTQAEVKQKWSDMKQRLAAHIVVPPLNRESAQLWVTLLSQGWWEHMWMTLITPKVNTYICVTHNKRVHTVTYSAEVRRGKGEAD